MFSHIDKNENPTMVNIADKKVTKRFAKAQTLVKLPEILRPYFSQKEIQVKKGPVFQTAIIAATMAVKKTFEVIPFCHPIPLEHCSVSITSNEKGLITIICEVQANYKTGIEMEALHGATIAALTIYDICKALSHDIKILETKLLCKTGGKSFVFSRPIYGLVLTGGKSSRMQTDKALIQYQNNQPHAAYLFELLKPYCEHVYLSAQKGQWDDTSLKKFPTINDAVENSGPVGAMLSAFQQYPDVHWLVVACDLAFLDNKAIENLLQNANENVMATCYKNQDQDFPEALCGFYTPLAHDILKNAFDEKITCPVKILRQNIINQIIQVDDINLDNINTPEDALRTKHEKH